MKATLPNLIRSHCVRTVGGNSCRLVASRAQDEAVVAGQTSTLEMARCESKSLVVKLPAHVAVGLFVQRRFEKFTSALLANHFKSFAGRRSEKPILADLPRLG